MVRSCSSLLSHWQKSLPCFFGRGHISHHFTLRNNTKFFEGLSQFVCRNKCVIIQPYKHLEPLRLGMSTNGKPCAQNRTNFSPISKTCRFPTFIRSPRGGHTHNSCELPLFDLIALIMQLRKTATSSWSECIICFYTGRIIMYILKANNAVCVCVCVSECFYLH